jgi:hypothetical protein
MMIETDKSMKSNQTSQKWNFRALTLGESEKGREEEREKLVEQFSAWKQNLIAWKTLLPFLPPSPQTKSTSTFLSEDVSLSLNVSL